MASSRPMEPFSCLKVSSLLLSGRGGAASFRFLLLDELVPPDWPSDGFKGEGVDEKVELGGNDEELEVMVVVSVVSWNRVKLTIDLPGMGCLEI